MRRSRHAQGCRRTAPRSLAVLAASVLESALFPRVAPAEGHCEVREHGMSTAAQDNLGALEGVLKVCAGQTIHFAPGTYQLRPKGFVTGLSIPAGTTLLGDGGGAAVLRIADTGNFAALFWIRNVSNVAIRGLRLEGSSYESGCTRHLDYGHAVYVYSDAGKSESVESIDIAGNTFHDFNGQSWLTFNAADGSPGIGRRSHITIQKNTFESDANLRGSCSASGGIGYPTAMVWLHGSDRSARGLVANVSVASNTFEAGYIKTAVAIWSGTQRISVQYNRIHDAGAGLPPAPNTEQGRYAVSIYNSAHELPGLHPDMIWVVGNEITKPVSAGIYVAAAQNLQIARNRISGQVDRFDGTLPKGAIALNHAAKVQELRDNDLRDNYIGISSVGSEVNLGNNRIEAARGGTPSRIVGGSPGWVQSPRAPEASEAAR